jgi:hypothetical protein
MLAVTAVLLLTSMSWAVGGWTTGEAAVRNDYLARMALLGVVALLATWVARQRRDGLTAAILWLLVALAVVVYRSPVVF